MKDEQESFGMRPTDEVTPPVTPGERNIVAAHGIEHPRIAGDARNTVPDKSGGDRFGAAGAALWRAVVVDYELDSTESEILALACRALDRAARARAAVERDGEFIAGRYGDLKAHPGMLVVRDAESAALRALRSLHLSGIDLTLSQLRAPKR